jgi:AcrR family transcriptional regulator
MSHKTFYDLFADREECLLALIDRELECLAGVVCPVYECESEWVERIRSGLGTLLAYLDADPAVCELLFVAALGGGLRVRERRAGVLGVLARVIAQDAGADPDWSSSLLAEGVVGGAFAVIQSRVAMRDARPLIGLLEELTATIVLLYDGAGVVAHVA